MDTSSAVRDSAFQTDEEKPEWTCVRLPGTAIVSRLAATCGPQAPLLSQDPRYLINWTSADTLPVAILHCSIIQRSDTSRYELMSRLDTDLDGTSVLPPSTRFEVEIPDRMAQMGGTNADLSGTLLWPWVMYEYDLDATGREVAMRKNLVNTPMSVCPEIRLESEAQRIYVALASCGKPSLPSGNFYAHKLKGDAYMPQEEITTTGLGPYEVIGNLWLSHTNADERDSPDVQDEPCRPATIEMLMRRKWPGTGSAGRLCSGQ